MFEFIQVILGNMADMASIEHQREYAMYFNQGNDFKTSQNHSVP